jgi:hypothetical protein
MKIARIISTSFPHVRVDLYKMLSNEIYFNEMTFYDRSGLIKYGSFDYIIGREFNNFF